MKPSCARLEAQGVGLLEFVREAIAEKLERQPAQKPPAFELGQKIFGRHGSGQDDRSTRRKAAIADMLRAKHRR